MKILVTVGTTTFDSLVEYIDKEKPFHQFDIEFQIANGKYTPVNHRYFRFVDPAEIISKYESSDIIITHAGIGTVIQLLEMKKRLIAVPNLERVDKHQMDLSAFIARNRYALVAYDFSQLGMFIEIYESIRFNQFSKIPFFKADEIREFFYSNNSDSS
jgi:beta-1,4-N-acetylglucosaminyltransferase